MAVVEDFTARRIAHLALAAIARDHLPCMSLQSSSNAGGKHRSLVGDKPEANAILPSWSTTQCLYSLHPNWVAQRARGVRPIGQMLWSLTRWQKALPLL
jgi:hypothetical protein